MTLLQAISAWFYIGQPELAAMLNCPGTVAAAIAGGGEGGAESAVIARALKTAL